MVNATAIDGSFANLMTGDKLVAVVPFYLDNGTSCLVDNPADGIVQLSIDSSSITPDGMCYMSEPAIVMDARVPFQVCLL